MGVGWGLRMGFDCATALRAYQALIMPSWHALFSKLNPAMPTSVDNRCFWHKAAPQGVLLASSQNVVQRKPSDIGAYLLRFRLNVADRQIQ